MHAYSHRQTGMVTLVALGLAALLTAAITLRTMSENAAGAIIAGSVFVVVALCLWQFSSLSVEVTERQVQCWFGPGWIRKSFALEQIVAARPVRNRWFYGWGIRLIPKGWMFNVSGLDAVELELASGKRFRIGTDEPQQLARAIENARAS